MSLETTTDLNACERKGQDISLYYNTGTCETPVWVFHKGVTGDLTVTVNDDEDEISLRDSAQNYKLYSPGRTDVNISGEMMLDPLYEGNYLFNSMCKGGAPADLLVLSGSIEEVGNIGYRGAFWNFDRSWSGPETGNATQSFSLKPAACQDCLIRTVFVDVAEAVEDYDPGVFVPAS